VLFWLVLLSKLTVIVRLVMAELCVMLVENSYDSTGDNWTTSIAVLIKVK